MRPLSRLALVLVGTAALTATAAAPARAAGFKTDLLDDMKDVSQQILELAQAVPAEKYAWRPAPGVRSIAEAYLHIAAGNYEILAYAGHPAPGAPADFGKFETSTGDKAEIIAAIKRSFADTRAVVEKVPDAALDKPSKPGSRYTLRRSLLELATHAHEHLGQQIAYARMNGVVPPWTAREQAAAPAPPKSGR